MRSVTLMDVYYAAYVLRGTPRGARNRLCRRMIWRAHVADKCVKRLRKYHPLWGDGSLRAAAYSHTQRHGPMEMSDDNLACIGVVIDALAQFRARRP